MTREEKLDSALREIRMQATRKERASGLKRYLETDLEIIARRATQALATRDDDDRFLKRPSTAPPFHGMMQLVED